MLAQLRDLHVWIELPDGKRLYSYSSPYTPNFDYEAVRRQLEDHQSFGRIGFAGRTTDGFGVLVSRGLPADDDITYDRMIAATQGLFDAPGFIVDLRGNGGGSEPRGQQLAALFADKRYLYGRSKRRSGPGPEDFLESPARYIERGDAESFTRPVICLIGPGCVSSGEGFAMMMKAMDHVTLLGQPTRGASGNPQAATLTNGVQVYFSRWVSMEPDGTPIETRGVQPDIRIAHEGPGDPTFAKALELLREKTTATTR